MISTRARARAISVNKIFIEQPSSELKVKVLIPMYEPLQVVKCKKSRKVIAELKELSRIRMFESMSELTREDEEFHILLFFNEMAKQLSR